MSHPNTVDLDDLLTTTQAAAILGFKNDTLEQWRWLGKGPRFIRLGNGKRAAIRYQRSVLTAWLEANTFQNTSLSIRFQP